MLQQQQIPFCAPAHKKTRQIFSAGSHSLGYKDSNLEMTESESVALPFGDSPILITFAIISENSVSDKYFFAKKLFLFKYNISPDLLFF